MTRTHRYSNSPPAHWSRAPVLFPALWRTPATHWLVDWINRDKLWHNVFGLVFGEFTVSCVYGKCLTAFARVLIRIHTSKTGWNTWCGKNKKQNTTTTKKKKNTHTSTAKSFSSNDHAGTARHAKNVYMSDACRRWRVTERRQDATLANVMKTYQWAKNKTKKTTNKQTNKPNHTRWRKNSRLFVIIWGNKMHQHKHLDRSTNLLWYGLTELMWKTKTNTKKGQLIDKLQNRC